MIYHIADNAIVSGPHSQTSEYVRKITRCGNPEVFSESELSAFGLVPEIKPALGEHQSYGDPVVTSDAVTFPVVDWTPEQIAAHEAEQLAARRAAMSLTPAQAELALLHFDLLDDVEAFIEQAPRAVQIEFRRRVTWQRTWPTLLAGAQVLGITDEQLDAIFEYGETQ